MNLFEVLKRAAEIQTTQASLDTLNNMSNEDKAKALGLLGAAGYGVSDLQRLATKGLTGKDPEAKSTLGKVLNPVGTIEDAVAKRFGSTAGNAIGTALNPVGKALDKAGIGGGKLDLLTPNAARAVQGYGDKISSMFGKDYNDKAMQLLALKQQQDANNKTLDNTQMIDSANSNAAATSAQNQTQTAQAQAKAAKNAGLTQARANAIGDASTYGNTIASNANNVSSQNAMTQADWLEKQGQIGAAMQQAGNMQNAAKYAGLSGALQGGAAGLSMGATISDENAKCDPIDDDKLNCAIQEFRILKRKLGELKESRKNVE